MDFALRGIILQKFQIHILVLLLAFSQLAYAQYQISGHVIDAKTKKEIVDASILIKNIKEELRTNHHGRFKVKSLNPGKYDLIFFMLGYTSVNKTIEVIDQNVEFTIAMIPLERDLEEVIIKTEKDNTFELRQLSPVEGVAIYASKKNEVVQLDNVNGNLATNNSRQIFSKIAGLNIWESDGAGLQLGIGGRGLNPSRTSNFNTRQNGYDISADAIGYPESYYTPPSEALEEIQIVRGASSLQYGPQFGGMVNFIFKKGSEDRGSQIVTRQTVGSYGLFNTFNSIGGTLKKLNYYAFFQYKRGDGWRENSNFKSHTGFIGLSYNVNNKLTLGLDLTHMNYLAQQPGGLTDAMFEDDPTQSIRDRNWFMVNWNIGAFTVDYDISERTKLNIRTFALQAERNALGYLGFINRADPMENRSLIKGEYHNIGQEGRLLHQYKFKSQPATFLIGYRAYSGFTINQQGDANDLSTPDFDFLNPNNLEESDYENPSRNFALFSENVFNISDRWSITPGVRLEYINSGAVGNYRQVARDLAGNIIAENIIDENKQRKRTFFLAGIGSSYKFKERLELYANFSQNYRGITFNDLRVVNPNFRIDPDIQDERGYNADIGFRGRIKNLMLFDISTFYLRYQDKIGLIQQVDEQLFTIYQYRTNISDSRNIGLEAYTEINVLNFFKSDNTKHNVKWFVNGSVIDARYINTDEPAIANKQVELVPPVTLKTGASYQYKNFKTALQYSYTQEHFTDATNATFTANAVNGVIPTYDVWDVSFEYRYKFLQLEAGVNNLLNRFYFTRRAEAYPGPGIIPSDPRTFYITLQGIF